MTSLVVDASVAARWILEDRYSREAARVLAGFDLTAPTLLHAEVASALTKSVKHGDLSADEALVEIIAFAGLELETVPDEDLAPRAVQLSCALDHSVYDCFYLALAMALEIPLVTADRELLETAQRAGYGEHVIWIGDVA